MNFFGVSDPDNVTRGACPHGVMLSFWDAGLNVYFSTTYPPMTYQRTHPAQKTPEAGHTAARSSPALDKPVNKGPEQGSLEKARSHMTAWVCSLVSQGRPLGCPKGEEAAWVVHSGHARRPVTLCQTLDSAASLPDLLDSRPAESNVPPHCAHSLRQTESLSAGAVWLS